MGILEEINEVLKGLKSDVSEISQKVYDIETRNFTQSVDDAIVFRFNKGDKLNLAFASKFLNLPQSKIIELVKLKELVTATKKHYVFYAEELIDFKKTLKETDSTYKEADMQFVTPKRKEKSPIISQKEMVELAAFNS